MPLPPSARPGGPAPAPGRPSTPAQAWEVLAAGNERFSADLRTGDAAAGLRASLVSGQHPYALVVGCSDSRVPAELVFDAGLGDLFVVRTAGHAVDGAVLGSVEYGVAVLGVPLVVVLGHERCGAVAAAVDALDGAAVPGGWVRDVVERVAPSVLAARRSGRDAAEVGEEHVRATVDLLVERSRVLADGLDAGSVAVLGTTYDLATGRVRLLEARGDAGAPGAG